MLVRIGGDVLKLHPVLAVQAPSGRIPQSLLPGDEEGDGLGHLVLVEQPCRNAVSAVPLHLA